MGVRNILTGAGAVVGSLFGQPQLGLAIGSLIGNVVDPQRIKTPGLKEFPVLGVTEGAYRQVAYGTTIIRDCQLIDWGPLDPVTVEERQGKGGGPVVESQRLYQTYAVAIGEPIEAVRYIKRDGVMVYDLRLGSTILPESADFAGRLRIYLGDEAQLPDPDLEALALNGVGNTPSYRGTSYFVVVRDDLTDLGGRIPTYEVEVVKEGATGYAPMTLGTNRQWYSGPESALVYGSDSMDFTKVFDRIKVSPDGVYCAGIDRSGADPALQISKFSAGAWTRITAPAVPAGYIPQSFEWHPSGGFYLITYSGTAPLADTISIFRRVGDSFSRVSFGATLPTNQCTTLAWNRAGTLFASNQANSGARILTYDFDVNTELTSNKRVSPNLVDDDGDFTRLAFDEVDEYLACGGATKLVLLAVAEASIRKAAVVSGASNAFGRGVSWRADYVVTMGDSGEKGRVYSFDRTPMAESITLSSNFSNQPSGTPIDSAATADGRYIAVVNLASNGPQIYDMGDAATPVATKLTNPATGPGVTSSVSFSSNFGVEIGPGYAVLSDIIADICDRCGIPAAKLDLTELTDEVKGLALGGQYDGAGAITTLMPPYFFDLFEADKLIHAPKRGGAAVLTIPESDLIEDIDENSLRGQDIEYPRKLQLKYLNPGQNYAAPAAVFARTTPDIRVRGEANMDLPICMDETQALQTAERILKVMWEDLNGEVTFSLPAGPYAWLSPTDCVGLSIRGALYRIRVEKVEDVEGVLKVTARRDRQSAYTSVLTALPLPPPAAPPPSLAGITQFVVLNIPGIQDADDILGLRIGVCGLAGSAWAGATVRYSIDVGASWTNAATLTTAARLGTLTTGLPSNLPGYTDATNPLNVTMLDDRQLEAVTQLQLLQEGNGAAIAYADGTAELLQFRDVADNGSRSWTLRTLLRGGLNTEADAHTAGAKFVMLDGTTFVPLPTSLIGQTIRFQFVSNGTSPEAAPTFDLVWNPAVAQTEFPPASLALTRGAGLIGASWAPRERFGTDINPVPSINTAGLGWRVTLTDGTVTQVHDVLAPVLSTSDTAFTGPITASVSQLNRITGAGPATSGVI